MRRLRRAIGYALLAFLAIAVLAMLAAGYLLGTSSGAGMLLSRVAPSVPGQLEFEDVDGAVLRTLTVSGIRWRLEDQRVEVERLSVAAGLWPLLAKGLVDVEVLDVSGVRVYLPPVAEKADAGPPAIALPALPEVTLPIGVVVRAARVTGIDLHQPDDGGEPVAAQRIDRVELAASAFRSTIQIDRLVVSAPAWAVDLRGSAALGPALPLNLVATWQVRNVATGSESAAGLLSLSGSRNAYGVNHMLSSPYEISTVGKIMPGPDDTAFALVARIGTVTLPIGTRDVATSGATLEVDGTIGNWRATLGAGLDLAETGPLDIRVQAAGDLASATIEDALIDREAGGRISLSGDVGYAGGLSWEARFEAEALPLELVDPSIEGSLSATGTSAGTLAPELDVNVSLSALEGALRDRVIEGRASVAYRDGTVTIDDTELGIGSNVVRIDGRVGQSLELQFTADAPALADLYPGLSGGIEANAVLSGTRQSPGLRANLTGEGLGWQQLTVARLAASADIVGGAGELDVDARDVVAAGQRIDAAEIRARGSIDAHTITGKGALGPVEQLDFALRGGWRGGEWLGDIDSLAATLAAAGEREALRLQTTGPAPLSLGPTQSAVRDLCLAAAGVGDDTPPASLCIDADVSGGEVTASYAAEDILLSWLPIALPSGGRLRGALGSTGRIAVRDGEPSAEFDASVADASAVFFPGTEQQEIVPIQRFDLDGMIESGLLTASADAQFSEEAVLSADVSIANLTDTDGAVGGSLTVRLDDIARIDPLLAGVDILQGRLIGNLALSGTRSRPVAEGDAALSGGRVRIPDLGITLESLQLAVESGAGGALRYTGTALSGDGTLRIDGETSLRPETRFDTRLAVEGNRMLLVNLPDMRALADAKIDVSLNQGRYAVSGTVAVPEADVTVRALPASAVEVSSDAVVHRGNREALQDAERGSGLVGTIDVDATLGDAVHLRGFGLDTRLTGGLTLRQAVRGPLLGSGQLRLRDATYEAYGQKLQVERGILTFNGPLSAPFLDVRAARDVDGTAVGIDITGTPDRLQSSLYSSPTLPQAEILSLLLTGRSLNQASASEGSVLSNAALGLGLKQAGNIAASIGQTVGLDKLSIDGGAGDGRLLAGKNLSENLYIQYAYGLFDQVSSVLLRLKLSNRLSLETNSGESQSVDLIYEVGNIRL